MNEAPPSRPGYGYAWSRPLAPYARHSDGTLVPEGKPISNGWFAKLWRLPSLLIPAATAGWIVQGVSVAVWGTLLAAAVWIWRKAKP